MSNNHNVQRPFGVTLIMILIVINGILTVVSGLISALMLRDDINIVYSLILIILGLVYLAVAGALGRGNRAARMLIALITVLMLVVGIVGLFSGNVATGIIQIVISVIVLLVLFSRKASAFFN
jgi:hypothetical protein